MKSNEILEKITLKNKMFEIRLLQNDDNLTIQLFLQLFYDCFGFREHLDINWYNWFYIENPFGNCNNYGLYDKMRNKLIGTFGFSWIAYTVNGKDYRGKLAVNGMISKEYTGQGLYSLLIEKTSQIEARNFSILFSFPHCNNKPSSKGHYNAGWNFNQKCHFYSKNVRNIKNAFNVKFGTDCKDFLNIWYGSYLTNDSFSFNRDNDWLNWRFFKRPNKLYHYVVSEDLNKTINGYMILGFYKNQTNKRCQIVDYRIQNSSALHDLLRCAENVAFENKCNILDIMLSDLSSDLDTFKKNSFEKNPEYYELLVYSSSNVNFKIDPLLGDFDCV